MVSFSVVILSDSAKEIYPYSLYRKKVIAVPTSDPLTRLREKYTMSCPSQGKPFRKSRHFVNARALIVHTEMHNAKPRNHLKTSFILFWYFIF